MRTVLLALIVIFALPALGEETVSLNIPGNAARGVVISFGQQEVVLKSDGKEQRIPTSILSPMDIYVCRRALIDFKDSKTVFDLCDYCIKQKFFKEAEALLEAAFRADADTYREKYQEILKKAEQRKADTPATVASAHPADSPQKKTAVENAPLNEEEFLGPFASWADLKRDYGAVGDGKADDTAAWQKAFDELHLEKRAKSVLYVPAGTYRIVDTIKLTRVNHSGGLGIGIYGEDPTKTVIRWDGAAGGVMLSYNPWYAHMGRLTFDGAGKAKTAIQHGPSFSTANEFSDMIVKDVEFGIEAGKKDGIAETTVLRCLFQHCSQAGISIQNWNSLDWYIWQCHFEGCRNGVTNRVVAGNFHVYDSVFQGSTEGDIIVGNTMYFLMRHNISIGSKFFFGSWNYWCPCPLTFEGNTIIGTKEAPINVNNMGPVFLTDNLIANDGGALVKFAPQCSAVSVGNTFMIDPQKAITHSKRFDSFDDHVGAVATPPIPPLVFAPHPQRTVIELPTGAKGAAIQAAIDKSVPGTRTVIHLPAGNYTVSQPLTIPERCDVQIVGDGEQNATSLGWSGNGEGPIFLIAGNSRATLRDMSIGAGKRADAIVISGDSPGSRVIMRQVSEGDSVVGYNVQHLTQSNVYMQDCGHGSSAVGVKVVGAGMEKAAKNPGGRVMFLSGASSNNQYSYEISNGGWLSVRDIWYETGSEKKFMKCTDSGFFTLNGAQIAHTLADGIPSVLVDNFKGKLCFIGACFSTNDAKSPAVQVKGEGKDTQLFLLGTTGFGEYLKNESPQARVVRLDAVEATPGGGAKLIDNVGTFDPRFGAEMLAQARGVSLPIQTPVPVGAGDVRFYRLCVSGRNAVSVIAAGSHPDAP